MIGKLLIRSFRRALDPRPDISKASELVLTLTVFEASANSGSPEFFVQQVIPFRISHPKNPKVPDSFGYEFVGHIVRHGSDGAITERKRASLVCRERAWARLERNKPFTVALCEMCEQNQKKRFWASASRRAGSSLFDISSLLPRKRNAEVHRNLL